jgi:hypothetical protein
MVCTAASQAGAADGKRDSLECDTYQNLFAGIRHMVLERSQQLTQHPQAHYINNRTMEVQHRYAAAVNSNATSDPTGSLLIIVWRYICCSSCMFSSSMSWTPQQECLSHTAVPRHPAAAAAGA